MRDFGISFEKMLEQVAKWGEKIKENKKMSEIEVGEYIRTKEGQIYKADEIFLKHANIDLVKHSKNIIDLLRPKDLVNGECIVNIDDDVTKYGAKTIVTEVGNRYFECQIIEILTFETYKQNCYKVVI